MSENESDYLQKYFCSSRVKFGKCLDNKLLLKSSQILKDSYLDTAILAELGCFCVQNKPAHFFHCLKKTRKKARNDDLKKCSH
jgi:hypothetical protein